MKINSTRQWRWRLNTVRYIVMLWGKFIPVLKSRKILNFCMFQLTPLHCSDLTIRYLFTARTKVYNCPRKCCGFFILVHQIQSNRILENAFHNSNLISNTSLIAFSWASWYDICKFNSLWVLWCSEQSASTESPFRFNWSCWYSC